MMVPVTLYAQVWSLLGQEETSIDTTQTKKLRLGIDALAFFHDNEFDSDITKGYTLPGAWVRPTLQYNPVDNVHLELGASALFFDGANKYPNYAYHDIAKWKGNQYQSGVHLLPWLRAQMDLGKVNVILGDIYGAQSHHFSTPLYNNEQLLSADPEMGAQILYKARYMGADVFVNWQSFQFKEDTHQEAFTVGLTSFYSLSHGYRRGCGSMLRLQLQAQHRGGELDAEDLGLGVQTLCNGAFGWEWQDDPFWKHPMHLEANILACYQQAGHLWSFDSGLAFQAECGIVLTKGLQLTVGDVFAPKNFVSLYGSTFFSTVSLKHPGLTYERMNTLYSRLDYSKTFAKAYTFGACLEAYGIRYGKVATALTDETYSKSANPFSFGLYIRVKPEFILSKTH